MYHGSPRMCNYFEGWYFKLVDPSEETIYAVIPGSLSVTVVNRIIRSYKYSTAGLPDHSIIDLLLRISGIPRWLSIYLLVEIDSAQPEFRSTWEKTKTGFRGRFLLGI